MKSAWVLDKKAYVCEDVSSQYGVGDSAHLHKYGLFCFIKSCKLSNFGISIAVVVG